MIRAQRTKQLRDARRLEILENKRISSSSPKVVAVLALSGIISDLTGFIETFAAAAGITDATCLVTAMMSSPNLPVTITVKKYNLRISLFPVQCATPMAALEIVKVADLLIVVYNVSARAIGNHVKDNSTLDQKHFEPPSGNAGDISAETRSTLSLLRSFGLPSTICALHGLHNLPLSRRAAHQGHITATVLTELQMPRDRLNFFSFDSHCEQLELLRKVVEHRAVQPRWRSQRAYVLAERATLLPELPALHPIHSHISRTATISVEGYVRGSSLSVQQLIHIPGIGDFPVERVASVSELSLMKTGEHIRKNGGKVVTMRDKRCNSSCTKLQIFDPQSCETPVRENVPNSLAGDQTWPTELELVEATEEIEDAVRDDLLGTESKEQYDDQAALIPVSEIQIDRNDHNGFVEPAAIHPYNETCNSEVLMDTEKKKKKKHYQPQCADNFHANFGIRESLRGMAGTLPPSAACETKTMLSCTTENEEVVFPDEIVTPTSISARERFARYRGLRSFRTSHWDPKDQLPSDYERVFGFQNFKRASKCAIAYSRATSLTGYSVGTFIRVIIRGVPIIAARSLLGCEMPASSSSLFVDAVASSRGGFVGTSGVGPTWSGFCGGAGPVVLSALMKHECKLTVMHYGVTKSANCEVPVRSKTPLWFHVGFRRERASPIFSTDEIGDKHKFERYLHQSRPSIASVFGPVTYPPAPVLGFGVDSTTTTTRFNLSLVLSGSVREADPNRIILKRVIITGVPYKTHKAKAVVRQMFFNADDVIWFKPLELWTKYGMRGKIKDSVGTHGNMKCVFNGVIQQRDTICASLYKRVFPKFC